MKKSAQNIISLSLLWILLFPTIVKVEHHHEVFICDADGEQHLHQFHEKCDICSFEFPFYEAALNTVCFKIEQVVTDIYDKHNSTNPYNPAKYSFLLRAPPVVKVLGNFA